MGKCLKLCVLLMVCGLAFGCAGKKTTPQDESARVERFRRSYEAALAEDEKNPGTLRLLRRAKSAIGTPYVRGGTTPKGGFDCSGFVCWTYKSVGVELPRTAREQSQVGRPIRNTEEMKAGDIVAFRHPRRGYHTGIYVGDGKFIHSPRRRTSVRINSLSDPYFSQTFLGARRINVQSGDNLVAQAESRLDDYTEEKFTREVSSARTKKTKKSLDVRRSRNAGRNDSAQKQTTVALLQKDADKPSGKSSGRIGKSSAKPEKRSAVSAKGSAKTEKSAAKNKKSTPEKEKSTAASKSKKEAKPGAAKSGSSSTRSSDKNKKAGTSNKRSSK